MLSGMSLLPIVPGTSLSQTNQRRVILLELSGANDGLNTLVPFKDDRYHKLRPTLGLKQNKIIALDDYFGFNNALKQLMPIWEHGEMAIAQGLGYPNPNRSHFKSIALWETGGDGNRKRRDGWLTHDIEHAYAISNVDAHGISLGGGLGIFASPTGNWLSMSSADQFSGRTIGSSTNPIPGHNRMMIALREHAATLNNSIDRIAKKVENNRNRIRVTGGADFNAQLTHAINLINSGIDSPVIKISLGGFDTHENQIMRHTRLLKQLSSAIVKLRTELRKTDNWDNTAIITYSEFGRRAAENKSKGTDHGTASAHFVFGGNVNGGFYGQQPDLGNLLEGDLQFTMDYRALYSSVLKDWFHLPGQAFRQHKDIRLQQLFG